MKELSLIKDETRQLRNEIIRGETKLGFQGQVSDEKVILAEKFLKKFPIETIVENGNFEKFLEENELYPKPFPGNQEYHQLVKTVYRQSGMKYINQGVLSEQWRNPDNKFQIRIFSHGEELEVVSMARAAIDSAVSIEEKPKSVKSTRAKVTKKMIDAVNPSVTSIDEKGELVEALTITSKALLEHRNQKLLKPTIPDEIA